MRGLILAGGTGSRLFPLTHVTNKHLLPVGKYPMVVHPVMKLKQAGVTDILVVTGREHMGDMVDLLGSGASFGVEFTYRVQDEAGGIAQALMLARHFAGSEPVLVVLGDNIFSDSLTPFVEKFTGELGGKGAHVILKEVPDPRRFGVAEISGERVVKIVEKPKDPKTNLAVVGVYLYDEHVFEIIENLKPSDRGELEITDVNNAYVEDGTLAFSIMEGWWSDAGTFESYPTACSLAAEINWNLPDLEPAPKPEPSKGAGYIDPYRRVGWPPPIYPGYAPEIPEHLRAAERLEIQDAPLTEEDRKIARRKREREAAQLSMPKFKEPPKDPFPHEFDEEKAAPKDLNAGAAKDMADLIFMAEESEGGVSKETIRPELYKKTCVNLPDSEMTTILKDGTRSNAWVPEKYYDYVHFPSRVYDMNYTKLEHKLALATQLDKAIRELEEVTRKYPPEDDRHIKVGYYFTHRDQEHLLAMQSLGDSSPAQPHVDLWIVLDIWQEIEKVGFDVKKLRYEGMDARIVKIDSINQIPGIVKILNEKIDLRRGVAQQKQHEEAREESDDFGEGRKF